MSVEYLKYLGFGLKVDDWRIINIAVDGVQMPEFSVHESDWRRFEGTDRFDQFLINQGLSCQELEQQRTQA
jgi:hypothetical protein